MNLEDEIIVKLFKKYSENEHISDSIYFSLKSAIQNAVLAPGSKVSIPDICDLLGVSRTPVKEALLHLKNDELIRIESKNQKYFETYALEFDEGRDITEYLLGIFTASALLAQKNWIRTIPIY